MQKSHRHFTLMAALLISTGYLPATIQDEIVNETVRFWLEFGGAAIVIGCYVVLFSLHARPEIRATVRYVKKVKRNLFSKRNRSRAIKALRFLHSKWKMSHSYEGGEHKGNDND